MSRSRKKTPVTTYSGRSQKRSKRLCNRIFRRLEHQRIGTDYHIPHTSEKLWMYGVCKEMANSDGLLTWRIMKK